MFDTKNWARAPWQTFLKQYKLNDTTARYWKKKFGMTFKMGKNPVTGKRCAMITKSQARKIVDAINQVHLKGG